MDPARLDHEPAPGERRIVRAVSKGDRVVGVPPTGLVTSAVTGQGIEELVEAVLAAAVSGGLDQEGGALLTSERQRAGVARAAAGFERTGISADAGLPDEILALDAREAVDALAEVLGQEVGDEVLDALFARFCIGK
jgi:tRNA modification GTPase